MGVGSGAAAEEDDAFPDIELRLEQPADLSGVDASASRLQAFEKQLTRHGSGNAAAQAHALAQMEDWERALKAIELFNTMDADGSGWRAAWTGAG